MLGVASLTLAGCPTLTSEGRCFPVAVRQHTLTLTRNPNPNPNPNCNANPKSHHHQAPSAFHAHLYWHGLLGDAAVQGSNP